MTVNFTVNFIPDGMRAVTDMCWQVAGDNGAGELDMQNIAISDAQGSSCDR